MSLVQSPLAAVHREMGARMCPFGGWEMPLHYASGTLTEHRACRQANALFDVSHLGTVCVDGAGALERLQSALTNDLGRIGPGKAQYTHLLDEEDGSVLDDIIVWWHPSGRFDVMPNASNTARVLEAVGGLDTTRERALLALQGPTARDCLAGIAPEAAAVPRFGVIDADVAGVACTVAGTGYTGEDGVELAVPAVGAEHVWRALVDADAFPAGLGARDTLRLEAGLPLHGHELGPGITPLQAGLGWVVRWDKGDFRGRAALEAERARGVHRKLLGLVLDSRRPPRTDARVLLDGEDVGVVTSGNFSPVLERGIGLALVAPGIEPGASVTVDLRGSAVPADVVKPPFVRA